MENEMKSHGCRGPVTRQMVYRKLSEYSVYSAGGSVADIFPGVVRGGMREG